MFKKKKGFFLVEILQRTKFGFIIMNLKGKLVCSGIKRAQQHPRRDPVGGTQMFLYQENTMLTRLKDAIKEKRRGKLTKGIAHLHDNTSVPRHFKSSLIYFKTCLLAVVIYSQKIKQSFQERSLRAMTK